MDEISNKTLATLLVVAIVISLAGTFAALRGANEITNVITGNQATPDTDQGYTRVNITAALTIALTNYAVNFGDGYRNVSSVTGSELCNLSTDDQTKPACWYNESDWDLTHPSDIIVENTGNVQANVTIKSDNSLGTAFFDDRCTPGGTVLTAGDDWLFQGALTLGSRDGCDGGSELDTTKRSFSTTPFLICTNLTPDDNNDQFNVSIELRIPAGPAGVCNDSITFEAQQNY